MRHATSAATSAARGGRHRRQHHLAPWMNSSPAVSAAKLAGAMCLHKACSQPADAARQTTRSSRSRYRKGDDAHRPPSRPTSAPVVMWLRFTRPSPPSKPAGSPPPAPAGGQRRQRQRRHGRHQRRRLPGPFAHQLGKGAMKVSGTAKSMSPRRHRRANSSPAAVNKLPVATG